MFFVYSDGYGTRDSSANSSGVTPRKHAYFSSLSSGPPSEMSLALVDALLGNRSDLLVTACPKCQIHLTCAKSNTDIGVEVKDLYSYLAEQL